MRKKEFEKQITQIFLQNEDVKHVHVCEVNKDMVTRCLYKQQMENIIYTWHFYKGFVIVNYCKK